MPNWAFNADANTGHAFGIFMACVGALRTFGAPAPLTLVVRPTGDRMLTNEIHASLIYLDRDFISGKYEVVSGQSPASMIARTQGKKAGAAIPVFSAEVSAVETRSFPISTLEMLATVLPSLPETELDHSSFSKGMSSQFGWVNGALSTLAVTPSTGVPGTPGYQPGDEQRCFTLSIGSTRLCLITTPDYFVSGLDALLKMHKVLLKDISVPIRAYVRVIAAQNYRDEWIAIPCIMHEREA